MDPQKLSQLDPKLREAYQRVMGTTPIPPPATPPIQEPHTAPQPPIQPPASEPQSIPTPELQPAIPQPQPPVYEPSSIPEPAISPEPPVQAGNFVQMNSEAAAAPSSPNFSVPQPQPQAQIVTFKKKNGMMLILIGIAGLGFIAVYTFFWTKIFNFKLPFLP